MPDANGMLLPAERQTIADLMKSKIKPPPCPWCGSNSWEVGPFVVVTPPVRLNGGISTAGPVMPLVTLMSSCGYIAHFAAGLFGVEVRPNAPGAPAPEAPQ